MARTQKVTNTQIAEALEQYEGCVPMAAKALGITSQAVYKRIKNNDTLRSIQERKRTELVDIAELSLRRKVMDGEGWAVCFTLKTLGRDRGYSEKQELEVSGPGGLPIQHDHMITMQQVILQLNKDDDYRKLANQRLLGDSREVIDSRPLGSLCVEPSLEASPSPNGNGRHRDPLYPEEPGGDG